jgi:hypothetical protein
MPGRAKKDHFYSIRAFRRYRRYFFHGLRNNKDTETSADEAMDLTKQEMLEYIKNQEPEITDIDIMEQWGNILQYLLEWSILLVNIPIDKERLAEATKELKNPDKPLTEATASTLLPAVAPPFPLSMPTETPPLPDDAINPPDKEII